MSSNSDTRSRFAAEGVIPVSRPQRRCGFTLIELLVTIAIIAILITLTATAVGRSLSSARAVVSANNLRTLGNACILYSSDNGGKLPNVASGHWTSDIYPYIYNRDSPSPFFNSHLKAENLQGTVYDCPFGKSSGEPEPIRRYGINIYLQEGDEVGGIKPISVIRLIDPPKSMLLATSNRSAVVMHHRWNFSDRVNGKVLVQFADLRIQRFEIDSIPSDATDIFWKAIH